MQDFKIKYEKQNLPYTTNISGLLVTDPKKTNNIEDYQSFFSTHIASDNKIQRLRKRKLAIDKCKLPTHSVSTKLYNRGQFFLPKYQMSGCIFAVYNEYDDNGAIISDQALKRMEKEIAYYAKFYCVFPVLYSNKENLNQQINNLKDEYNIQINLLVINAHGENTKYHSVYKMGGFSIYNSTVLSSITSDTQVIFHSCYAAKEPIESSVCYSFCKDNKSSAVFGATKKITNLHPVIQQDEQMCPEVVSTEFVNGYRTVPSYKMMHLEQRQQESVVRSI